MADTVDLWAFQRLNSSPALAQSLLLPVAGYVCAGIDKLAQRWLIELLTVTGSVRFDSTRGCRFISAVRSGQLRVEEDIRQEFGFAATKIYESMRVNITEETPLTERLKNASLASVTLQDTQVELQITITSEAEASRTVVVPVAYYYTGFNYI